MSEMIKLGLRGRTEVESALRVVVDELLALLVMSSPRFVDSGLRVHLAAPSSMILLTEAQPSLATTRTRRPCWRCALLSSKLLC